MTEDFKSLLLKYLTGNITKEQGDNIPQFGKTEKITNNLYNYIKDNYSATGIINTVFFQKSKTNNNYLFGGWYVSSGNSYGFIIILDESLNIIFSTNKYSSNVYIGQLLDVKQNSDGSYYFIEKQSDGTRRIVTLNNISQSNPTTNEYSVTIKKSYTFSSTINSTMTISSSIKNENTGRYFVYGTRINGTNSNPYAFELVVNVGSENEWKIYDYVQTPTTILNVYSGWANWDSNNDINFKLIGGDIDNSGNIYVYSKNGDNIGTPNTYNISKTGTILMSGVVLNETTSYVLVANTTNTSISDYYQTYYLYMIKSGTLKQIYASDTTSRLQVDHNFFWQITTDYINTYISFNLKESSGNYNFYMGLVIDENVYVTELENVSTSAIEVDFLTQTGTNTYNLYEFMFQTGNNAYRLNFTYDRNGYNGYPYENINSLVPHLVKINDNNNRNVFARTLYNKTISNNITTSTVQIPNTFLNDTTISHEILYGETNMALNEKSEMISKNIYETLNINFINTITMSNENTQDTILNPTGATRLNKSSANDLDYDNTKANKLKINYDNGNSFIQELSSSQIELIDSTTAMYDFVVYAEENISNIQIISNDEQTVYQEITNLVLNKGKFYSIIQMVEVEGE